MSDANEEIADLGQQALRTARVEGLRRRMSSFIDTHEGESDLKELRSGVASMSELVDEGRAERM